MISVVDFLTPINLNLYDVTITGLNFITRSTLDKYFKTIIAISLVVFRYSKCSKKLLCLSYLFIDNLLSHEQYLNIIIQSTSKIFNLIYVSLDDLYVKHVERHDKKIRTIS